MFENSKLLGVVLSGGRSQRMGSDKALIAIGDTTLLDHIYNRLSLQMLESQEPYLTKGEVIVSTNNPLLLAKKDRIYMADKEAFSNLGPLSGIYAAAAYAQNHNYRAIVTVAVDTPFFPKNYIARLQAFYKADLDRAILSTYNGEYQPTFGLWPVNLIDDLKSHLQAGKRSIYSFAQKVDAKNYEFGNELENSINPFFNVNTKDDLEVAKSLWC
ncbi:molybdenum cofactor guanylyltransferase [Bartonella sp. HY329]|uniref:molybdenum cofactor guanylyltransferase n=1 Tax=unclassified Bartonella TaxID=2645622 RepID=UPI0021C8892B|nr:MULTISPECIES: molybdenum cofactor guanylyltransferase [unclassified Bartonella]UXM94052.1 molybdenum cofactor guanylyltransferase [Bartonella sp. HY329]UXN08374.1 molybdenum cofactor guanylyltransferase [Bartonella sp. HY328]